VEKVSGGHLPSGGHLRGAIPPGGIIFYLRHRCEKEVLKNEKNNQKRRETWNRERKNLLLKDGYGLRFFYKKNEEFISDFLVSG